MAENKLSSRLKHAWNAFFNKDPTEFSYQPMEFGSAYRPDRRRSTRGVDRSIVNSVYNRLAMDVAAIDIFHVKVDDNGRFVEQIDSGLNNCLTLEANIDQTARAFKQDVAASMFDEGVVAICPIDVDEGKDPNEGTPGAFDILTMRTGKVLEWYPDKVKVNAYDERDGKRKDIIFRKQAVAIVENPLYSVMNEPNSVMQRLIRKLALLDMVDEQNASDKLNIIIQLPYVVKTKVRQDQAEARRQSMEDQLANSKYGVAYMDSTEKITQLSKPLENNLLSQVEYLTNQLYSQLGLTQEILNGTADEKTMLNYYNRTIEPIVSAIVDEMKRKFLTKTARSQHQSIASFRSPFKLVPVSDLAEIADKFTRNEILTANEVRQIIGMKPAQDAGADELRNKNMPISETGAAAGGPEGTEGSEASGDISSALQGAAEGSEDDSIINELLDHLSAEIDKIVSGVENGESDEESGSEKEEEKEED